MRLTPADVHNVAFKKPSIGKRGYDEDEVDAFLDIVEAELSRLIEENNELTQKLAGHESGAAQAAGSAAAPADESGPGVQQLIEQAPVEAAHEHEAPEAQQPAAGQPVEQQAADYPTAEQPAVDMPQGAPAAAAGATAAPAVSAATAAPAGPSGGLADHHIQAARLLGLAQETAERVTGEASAEAESTRASARAESEKLLSDSRNESEKLLSDSHSESEKLLSDSRNESERMVSEAKNSSESMVAEATAKAEATVRDSQLKAEAIDREAQRKYNDVMTQLTTQRTGLEKKIDDLRVYEREYRSRLKGWITDQLHQLDASDGDVTVAAGGAQTDGAQGADVQSADSGVSGE